MTKIDSATLAEIHEALRGYETRLRQSGKKDRAHEVALVADRVLLAMLGLLEEE